MKKIILIIFLLACSVQAQNIRIDQIKGLSDTLTIHKTPYVNQIFNPTVDDTISLFKTDRALTIDSVHVRADDDIQIIATFGGLGEGTTVFNSTINELGWQTINTFTDATIPAGNEVYLYFTSIGGSLTYLRWKIYWRDN